MAVDTSTEAVTKLLDGVTPGPWAVEMGTLFGKDVGYTIDLFEFIPYDTNERHVEDARFIIASRGLVPALLAERDALTQSRNHFKSRADANKARVKRLRHRKRALVSALEIVTKAESLVDAKQAASLALGGWQDETLIHTARTAAPKPITLHDAAKVPEVQALIDAAKALHIDMLERAECRMDTIRGEQYRIVNSGRTAWANFDAALRAIT